MQTLASLGAGSPPHQPLKFIEQAAGAGQERRLRERAGNMPIARGAASLGSGRELFVEPNKHSDTWVQGQEAQGGE